MGHVVSRPRQALQIRVFISKVTLVGNWEKCQDKPAHPLQYRQEWEALDVESDLEAFKEE